MREYLHNKLVETQRQATQERKEQVKRILEKGEVDRKNMDGDKLLQAYKETTYDDAESQYQNELDNEYAMMGVEDPLVAVTTSRDPSGPIKTFAREISQIIPNAQRLNRGATDMKALAELCRRHEFTDLVIVHGTHGKPDSLLVCHLPYGPTAIFTLKNVVMRRDIPDAPPLSQAFPHLVFEDMTSKVGKRVTDILKALFPVPKAESRRIISFVNRNDWISFRQHTFTKIRGEIKLEEIGPRMEMGLYKIIRGTIDTSAPDVEFTLRSFINSRAPVLKAKEESSDDEQK